MKQDRSRELFEEAQKHIPGGVNSPVRAFRAVGGTPPFITSGTGAIIRDEDGNEFIDYVGSWGPHLLGHAHPAIVAAVAAAAASSTSFGAPHEGETLLAKSIREAVPSIEKIRLTNSGTEAAMSALRVARGFTGRSMILKFIGCYHGHVDSLLVNAGSGALTFGTPSSAGVPPELARLTISVPFNDMAAVEAAFREHGQHIACVVLEPVCGNMGTVKPIRGFLESLRAITQRNGSLLVFDEVMTGFRLAWGGAQELYSIRPDLTVLGKVVGGGLPLAAFGGRADVMDSLAPLGKVYQAGTLSGNPVAVAAGRAALATIREKSDMYQRLEVLSARLAFGLQEAAEAAGVECHLVRVGSMLTPFFATGPIHNMADAMRSDTARFGAFHRGMLERGVYLPASQFEAWFISDAHTFDQIDATIAAARDTLGAMARR